MSGYGGSPVSMTHGDSIANSGVASDVKWAAINATSSGDTTVVAAVTAKKIRVFAVTFVCAAAVEVGWKSGANSKIAGMSFAANGGMDVERTVGFFVETNAGEALVINLGGAVAVRGSINYVEVD